MTEPTDAPKPIPDPSSDGVLVPGAPLSIPTTTEGTTSAPSKPPAGGEAVASEGLGLPLVAVMVVGALALGALIGRLVNVSGGSGSGRTAPPPTAPTPPPFEPTPSPPPGLEVRPLAEAAVDVRDRLDNPLLADRLGAGLAAVGWITVDPTGTWFDPAQQTAVDREVTDRQDLHGAIAAVERVGYADASGALVRLPEVIVYHYERPATEAGSP